MDIYVSSTVDTGDSWVFKEGHSIRLSIACANNEIFEFTNNAKIRGLNYENYFKRNQ